MVHGAGWRDVLLEWAEGYAGRLAADLGRGGVVIGGSIARDQSWEHSDLEVGVLVDELDPQVPHFGTDAGRGVETFQLRRPDLKRQLERVRGGDLEPVAGWPIQLWRGRVTHDPSGLLEDFVTQFERHLFSPDVLARKLRAHRAAVEDSLARSADLLASGRPRAALSLTRLAMNELIQMSYWRHQELPRSQNRTASRFRALAEAHGLDELYALFVEVFALDEIAAAITVAWPHCREQVLALSELSGGPATRQFFTVAVDSNFEWGEDDGIICVYRLYVPLMGGPDRGILSKLDDEAWCDSNRPLLQFLGLQDPSQQALESMRMRLALHAV